MADEPGTYASILRVLELELDRLAQAFAQLTDGEWALPTQLAPPESHRAPWTLFELAGHLDVAIGLTSELVDNPVPGQPDVDAVSFFAFPSPEVPIDFYEYAFVAVEDHTTASMPAVLRDTFARAIEDSRATRPDTVCEFPGYEPNPHIRLEDWVSGRIVEAVVHGIDLTDVLGRPVAATEDGIAHTARLLDGLLALRGGSGRPDGLDDDLAWVRAASGRGPHPDPRLPVLA